ncbi:MAG: type II secretion system F family protein [Candidatus Woesearchaeota archaeon]
MPEDPKTCAKKIVDLAEEVRVYRQAEKKLEELARLLEQNFRLGKITQGQYLKQKNDLLQGKSVAEWREYYKDYISSILDEIGINIDSISSSIQQGGEKPKIKVVSEKQVEKAEKLRGLDKKTRQAYLKQLQIDEDFLEDLVSKRKSKLKKGDIRVQYTLYKTHEFGILANRLFEKATVSLIKQYPEFFQPLFRSLRMSGVKVLSKTYVSMMLLGITIAFVAVMLLTALLYKHTFFPFQVFRGLLFGLIAAMITGAVLYFYPQSVASERDSSIRNEIPFVTVHMSAVAGSGAKPISMFKTLLASEEYPHLRNEIKKIVNYVTIFGYDLPTAMKTVARTTPSIRFKDLLDGIVNNIETGGDLKDYLTAIADEALATYRIERQRYVETIATYSDIYTGLLIAAPLLFFATLAIIQTLGGEIGGMSVSSIAMIGTYIVIPMLNLGFIAFLKIMAPK